MKLSNKIQLLQVVNQKLAESKKRLVELETARNSAESAMTSRYDTQRESLEMDVGAQKKTIKALEEFQTFLENVTEKDQIEEGAQFTLTLTGSGEKMEKVIFAPLSVGLEGIQIITAKSPLGAALLGKKAGEGFSYQVGNVLVKGILQEIE